MPEYYTLKQAADKMNISRSTIMKLIRLGKLKTHKLSAGGGERNKHLVTQEQIDECIQGK